MIMYILFYFKFYSVLYIFCSQTDSSFQESRKHLSFDLEYECSTENKCSSNKILLCSNKILGLPGLDVDYEYKKFLSCFFNDFNFHLESDYLTEIIIKMI